MDGGEIEARFARKLVTGEQDELLLVKEAAVTWLAQRFNELLPDGREKSLALTALEEAGMWASKAVMR